MAELVVYLVLGVLGFTIGGIVGLCQHVGFFPDAWIGLGLVWGVTVCGHCGCEL